MKIVVDATAVRDQGGGLSTYAASLVRAWDTTYPNELVVVAGDGSGAALMGAAAADVRAGRLRYNRIIAQHVLVPAVVRDVAPDAVLSVVPAVPAVRLGVPVVCVVHDLRSWKRPEEFSFAVRTYRKVAHHQAFHRVARISVVSERSKIDLSTVCRQGALKARVIHPGADHVDEWDRAPRSSHVLTFGHWSNKRPDLAIETWAAATRAAGATSEWRLHVVGVPEGRRKALEDTAARLGVAQSVVVHRYLPESEYERLFTSASAVLMLSTFEGFGLPVIEAMRSGVHVIASTDEALQEAGGSSAVYVDDGASLLRALVDVFADAAVVGGMVAAGRRRTRDMTWASTAAQTRALIGDALSGRISGSGTVD